MIRTGRGGVRWTLAALFVGLCAAFPGASVDQLRIARTRNNSPRVGSAGLSVLRDGVWTRWWDLSGAPRRWDGPLATVTDAISWRPTSDAGVQWGELRLSGSGEAWRVRVIIARIDPGLVRIRLDTAFDGSIAHAAWTTDHAPLDAILAVNAGQFVGSLPWGWVVMNGRQFLKPGTGPLATAIVIDSAGAVNWIETARMPSAVSMHGIVDAFQSYPTLLRGDGDVPEPLQPDHATPALDIAHRDARLAIGQSRDGHLLIAITRFDALDGTFDYVPFGLTTPEMAAVMGALGCKQAVMLDGGISSQMMIRLPSGERMRWRGIRRVPLGLLVLPRD